MKIIITGATGYIGSHIAKNLIDSGHKVYATCRDKSNFERCNPFIKEIIWINQDTNGWKEILKDTDLDLLIHTAWAGVSTSDRDNWDMQMTNFSYSKLIFELALRLHVKKIICLGSQAEYGEFKAKVDEAKVTYPLDAYGAVKLLTLNYLRNLAGKQSFKWYWLRVFSIIGLNENNSWLLPQVMNKLLQGQVIELTEGHQSYDYLYMDDFVSRLNKVIECDKDNSGVYNICSGREVEICQLLLLIAEKLNVSNSLLKFGAIPYRKNQNMSMVGCPDSFDNEFGYLSIDSLEVTVVKITDFYKNKFK